MRLTQRDKDTLAAIQKLQDGRMPVLPSLKELAEESHLPTSTIRCCLAHLARLGLAGFERNVSRSVHITQAGRDYLADHPEAL
jgi:DNA-binding IclR family transcriptional regulator